MAEFLPPVAAPREHSRALNVSIWILCSPFLLVLAVLSVLFALMLAGMAVAAVALPMALFIQGDWNMFEMLAGYAFVGFIAYVALIAGD